MRSPAWLDNWPAGLTIEIKYLPCPLEPPAAVAFPRLRQPSPFPGLFNGYVVRRVVRPACCIIRGLTRIPAHIPARSVLKRLSLAITTVANTRNLLQGFILTSLQGARVGPSAPAARGPARRIAAAATRPPPPRRAPAATPPSRRCPARPARLLPPRARPRHSGQPPATYAKPRGPQPASSQPPVPANRLYHPSARSARPPVQPMQRYSGCTCPAARHTELARTRSALVTRAACSGSILPFCAPALTLATDTPVAPTGSASGPPM